MDIEELFLNGIQIKIKPMSYETLHRDIFSFKVILIHHLHELTINKIYMNS